MTQLGVDRVAALVAGGLRPLESVDPSPDLRPSAVLVPLLERKGEAELLFMRRTDNMPDHAGQVSFPGGVRDAGDHDLTFTALRESKEEVGGDPARIRLVGALEAVTTLRKYHIQPFLSVWPEETYVPVSLGEVARVFRVPLRWLLDPANETEVVVDHDGRAMRVDAWCWDSEIIWGATRRITEDLLRRIRFAL